MFERIFLRLAALSHINLITNQRSDRVSIKPHSHNIQLATQAFVFPQIVNTTAGNHNPIKMEFFRKVFKKANLTQTVIRYIAQVTVKFVTCNAVRAQKIFIGDFLVGTFCKFLKNGKPDILADNVRCVFQNRFSFLESFDNPRMEKKGGLGNQLSHMGGAA